MTILLPSAVALAGCVLVLPVRGRERITAPLAAVWLGAVLVLAAGLAPTHEETILDLSFRMTPLARLVDLTLLGLLLVIGLASAAAEPVEGLAPVLLFVAGATHAVVALASAPPLFLVLLAALIAPAAVIARPLGEERALDTAVRHFGSMSIGGTLGVAGLALAAQQPRDPASERFALALLLVLVVAAFAVILGALPFHGHLASMTAAAPPPVLALVFGVLMPLAVVSFPLLLTQAGVLPVVTSVAKAQTLLSVIGVTSAVGAGLLAIGVPDLGRLVAYSVIANLGIAFVGFSTFSSQGLVGALALALVTGVAATAQFLAAGTLGRAMLPDDRGPSARRAPLAALTFVAASLAIVGVPPLAGFAPRFFVEQIAMAVSLPLGTSLVASSLFLLVAHLRAATRLFAERPERWRPERRPVAAAAGLVLFVPLLWAGLSPDPYLRPVVDFARDFLTALRPF